jgi:hypothetical protein
MFLQTSCEKASRRCRPTAEISEEIASDEYSQSIAIPWPLMDLADR